MPGILWAAIILLGWDSVAQAQTCVPGQTYFDRSNYIEYIAGDLPVIFSAPHGGALVPAEIPDRQDDGSDPDYTTVTDSYTEETALAVQNVFATYYGHAPHVIICQLKRTKIDCNRSLSEGVYQTNAYATIAWNDFQNYINIASNTAATQNGVGFYIDLHGQGHVIQRLELGYLLTADQLTNTDLILDRPIYAEESSIRRLATIVSDKFSMPFAQLLRGTNSFGGLMLAQGYPCTPDLPMPNPGNGTNPIVYPGDENDYFDGGYNTAVHSSQLSSGPIDALQIEANMTGVRDTAIDRTNYALAIAQTLDYFFTNYYGLDLRISAPCIWAGQAGKWATATNWGGILPVAGNYLLFSGAGGAVTNNLSSLSTGTGRIYSLLFATNATGSYTTYGNALSVTAGITNFSLSSQSISNVITLLAAQTFSAMHGPLNFLGNVTNAGFNLTVNAVTNITFNNLISGSGGLAESGGGNLTLTAANSYTGATTNFSGALFANNATGCANGNGALFINAGALLGGTGTVSGPVTIQGTISPGNATGRLTVTNGLSLLGGNYAWTLSANATNAPGTNSDLISVTGGSLLIDSNATLSLLFTNAASLPATNIAFWQTPQTWKIISLGSAATNISASSFQIINNATFTAGNFTSSTDAQGNVLLNFTPTAAPLLSPALSTTGATGITIRWNAVANVTYQVQYATNFSPATWLPLGTVTATNSSAVFLDNSPSAPSRFYRLVIP